MYEQLVTDLSAVRGLLADENRWQKEDFFHINDDGSAKTICLAAAVGQTLGQFDPINPGVYQILPAIDDSRRGMEIVRALCAADNIVREPVHAGHLCTINNSGDHNHLLGVLDKAIEAAKVA